MTDKTHPDVPFRVWHRGGACVDVAHERDQARAMAALWKKTTREHVGRSRTALSWAEMCEDSARTSNARAVKAEKERDEWKTRAEAAEPSRDVWRRYAKERAQVLKEQRAMIESLRAAESRPLTPDAITDEMLYRGLSAYYNIETTTARWDADRAEDFRRALAAALTEPPKRPEAVEDIVALLDDYGMDDFEERDLLAEWLAKRGVRVVGEERS